MRTPTLAELQRWFRWKVVARTEAKPRPDCSSFLSMERRLEIYETAYIERLIEALSADFSALRRALGHEEFRGLTFDYLAAYPSRSPTVAEVGKSLPAFCSEHHRIAQFPWLADLALLEWSTMECFHADRMPPLDPRVFSTVAADAWPAARFTLEPSVRLMMARWPVLSLWEQREETSPVKLPKQARDESLIVYRHQGWPAVRECPSEALDCLKALARGESVAELCERPELAEAFGREFPGWVEIGIIGEPSFSSAS